MQYSAEEKASQHVHAIALCKTMPLRHEHHRAEHLAQESKSWGYVSLCLIYFA